MEGLVADRPLIPFDHTANFIEEKNQTWHKKRDLVDGSTGQDLPEGWRVLVSVIEGGTDISLPHPPVVESCLYDYNQPLVIHKHKKAHRSGLDGILLKTRSDGEITHQMEQLQGQQQTMP